MHVIGKSKDGGLRREYLKKIKATVLLNVMKIIEEQIKEGHNLKYKDNEVNKAHSSQIA